MSLLFASTVTGSWSGHVSSCRTGSGFIEDLGLSCLWEGCKEPGIRTPPAPQCLFPFLRMLFQPHICLSSLDRWSHTSEDPEVSPAVKPPTLGSDPACAPGTENRKASRSFLDTSALEASCGSRIGPAHPTAAVAPVSHHVSTHSVPFTHLTLRAVGSPLERMALPHSFSLPSLII